MMEEADIGGEYLIDTLFSLAMAHIELREINKAEYYLDRISELANQTESIRWLIIWRLFQAHIEKATRNYDKAYALYREARDLSKDFKELEVLVESILNQAQLKVLDL